GRAAQRLPFLTRRLDRFEPVRKASRNHRGCLAAVGGRWPSAASPEPLGDVGRKIDVKDGGGTDQVADTANPRLRVEESTSGALIVHPPLAVGAALVRKRHEKKGQLVADHVREAIKKADELVQQAFRHGVPLPSDYQDALPERSRCPSR